MEANELRVGNLVKWAKGVYLNDGETTEILNVISNETDFYEPIPITEEWLLKFGFIYIDIGEYILMDISIDFEYTDEGEFYFLLDNKVLCTIKYVHQLQNIYFFITNNELICQI